MLFDALAFEYEETADISISDVAVGKLNLLIYALILTACVYYLFTAWSPAIVGTLPQSSDITVHA